MNINDLANELLNAGNNSPESGFDITATVVRIEDGMAYVHIDGGAPETPALMTISAKVNDVVKVRIANGRAWITGNVSAPPTDDTAAELVAQSVKATNARIDNLFAQDITATGTIKGLKLKGSTITGSKFINEGSGEYGPWSLDINEGYIRFYDKTTGETLGVIGPDAGVHVGFESDIGATIGPWDMAEFRRRNSEGSFDQAAIGLQMFRVIRKDGVYPVYVENTNGDAIYATFNISESNGKLYLQNCEIVTDKDILTNSRLWAGAGTANQAVIAGGANYVFIDNRNAAGTMQNNIVLYPTYTTINKALYNRGTKMVYEKNDTITMANGSQPITIGGFLTSGGTLVYCTYFLNKPLASDVTGVTCTGVKGRVRQGGKYLLGSGTAGGEAAPSAVSAKLTTNRDAVHLILTIPAASASNNDAVGIQIDAGTIKFT